MKTAAAIIVGYTLKARPDAADVMPEFTAPSNYGPDKAAEYVRNKKEQWKLVGCASSPYSGTIARAVVVALPMLDQLRTGQAHTDVQKDFYNVVELSRYINSVYGSLYDLNGEAISGPLRVIAFDPRTFLKIVALEAAEKGVPLPHEMWYAADYRDIESAVCPEKSDTTLHQALKRLMPDEELQGFVPGHNPIRDAEIATYLTLRLNLLPAWNKELAGARQVLAGAAPVAHRPKMVTSPLESVPKPAGADPTKPKKKPVKPLAS